MDLSVREVLAGITTVRDMVKAFQAEEHAGGCSKPWSGQPVEFARPAAIAAPSP